MKKFAIIAAVVAGFLGLTAAAEAGYYTTRIVGYHCGRPIVRQVYVETCQPRYYGGGYSSYRGGSCYNPYYQRRSYSYSYSGGWGGGYGYRGGYSYGRSRCR